MKQKAQARTGTRLVLWAVTAVWTAHAQPLETVLHPFAPTLQAGANPSSGVIRDGNGNLYGTTYSGGSAGLGVVYRVDPTGKETVLHSFRGGTDGANPIGGVYADGSGNLWGTTYYGGASNAGVVYQLDSTGKETILHAFTGSPDGANPHARVIRDPANNLYGTTETGGSAGEGTVFKVDTSGHETVLYSFVAAEGNPDGQNPLAPLTLDGVGNLYGTTAGGGVVHNGTIFRVSPSGQETIIYSFPEAQLQDGIGPASGVAMTPAGNFFGTTQYGGGVQFDGVAYEVSASGSETVLVQFGLGNSGSMPESGVVFDRNGNAYGTTTAGGANGGGVVYKVDISTHVETVLYSFTGGADGGGPAGGVVFDGAGNLYGATSGGGKFGQGAVFKLSPAGQETVLFSFPGATDGADPAAGVTRDAAGDLYGATSQSGLYSHGTVYTVSASGTESVLYNFTGGADGAEPQGAVTLDTAGNVYGTTLYGGNGPGCANCITYGVVYKVNPAGQESVIYGFQGGADGYMPSSGVIRDAAGNLYGTTSEGGASGYGLVYKIDSSGVKTTLYSFTGTADGAYPAGGLIRDAAGNFYGTAEQGGSSGLGVIYKLDTAGQFAVLHSFTGNPDGGFPTSGLIIDSAGNLYGTVSGGGAYTAGDVYKLSSAGQLTVLYTFTGHADGYGPSGGVIRDAAGSLYGCTGSGGLAGYGVVYKILPDESESVLYSFTGAQDGSNPTGSLTADRSGNLYGATMAGGTGMDGVVFELTRAADKPFE